MAIRNSIESTGGEPTASSGRAQRRYGTEKFTGYFRDSETGNDYAVNRYESPGTGRFLTPDRVSGHPSDPGSWNKYAYVAGDPVNRVDPAGLDPIWGGSSSVDVVAEADWPSGDWAVTDYNGDPGGGGLIFPMVLVDAYEDPNGPCSGQMGNYSSDCIAWLTGGGGNTQATGNGTGGVITTSNVTNIGDGESQIYGALKSLEAFIDPGCLTWLQSAGHSLSNEISSLISVGAIGYGGISTTRPNSVVNSINGSIDAPGYAIIINAAGAFWNSSYPDSSGQMVPLTVDNGTIKGGTVEAQIFLLIHELAHSMGVLGDDADSQGSVNANDTIVQNACGQTLNRFK